MATEVGAAVDGDHEVASEIPPGPLAGFAIGVTGARRHEDLAMLLERCDARVVHAPAIRVAPIADDPELLRVTRQCLARPLDWLVVTAAAGLQAWLEAAEGWGLREDLAGALGRTRLVAGTREAGAALHATVLHPERPVAPVDPLGGAGPARQQAGAEPLSRLPEVVAGARVGIQVYGEWPPELAETLRRAGAEVVEIPVYRWSPAEDPTPLRRLVGQAVAGTVDAIAFTSAPAVAATLAVAAEDGLEQQLVEALRDQIVAACVGPVTARALVERRVPTVQPERPEAGALVRAIVANLPGRRACRIRVRGHALELRGHAVVLDGQLRPIAPAPMAILRALARRPGHVVSRGELIGVLPGRGLSGRSPWTREGRPQADEHAVEMAVARLRRGLGRAGIVETVVKRGYRLACDPRTAESVG